MNGMAVDVCHGAHLNLSLFRSNKLLASPSFIRGQNISPCFVTFPKSDGFIGLHVSPCAWKSSPSYRFNIYVAAKLHYTNSEPLPESEHVPSSCERHCDGSNIKDTQKATFDTKLPRRNLIVQFTCNACGGRTQRTINRLAYERGTVFVQCAECFQHHKLVDNLGLVIEYDLREDTDVGNQV